MDFIDMLVNTSDEYLTGYFYKARPQSAEDGKITFKYKEKDPNSRVFDKLLNEVRADSARYAISTNDACGFNVGGYIVTQSGEFWEITDVVGHEQGKTTNNALRWFKRVKDAEIYVRMIKVNDLYAIEDAYKTTCTVTIALYVGGVEKTVKNAVSAGKYAIEVPGTNECFVTLPKNGTDTVTIHYEGGWKAVQIKKFNTQKQEGYIEVYG